MDRDGTKDGFDLDLTRAVVDAASVPVIASGGVGTLEHLVDGVTEGGADAVLAASIFHFGEHTVAEAKAAMAAAGRHRPTRLTGPASRQILRRRPRRPRRRAGPVRKWSAPGTTDTVVSRQSHSDTNTSASTGPQNWSCSGTSRCLGRWSSPASIDAGGTVRRVGAISTHPPIRSSATWRDTSAPKE